MPSPANPSKVYVENYDKIIRRIFPCYDEILSLISKNVPENSHNVLVYGCGTGNEICALEKNNLEIIHGVDTSSLMIEEATQKTKHLKNVSLYLADDFNAGRNGPYAVVVSTLVSHFLKTKNEKNQYLKNLRNYTVAGGLTILTDTFIVGDSDIDKKTYEQWEEYLMINHPEDRISKDFMILRENTYPVPFNEFEKMAKLAGFTTCHQIFEFFGVKTVLLS